jgi:alpha-L-rhamnosidase
LNLRKQCEKCAWLVALLGLLFKAALLGGAAAQSNSGVQNLRCEYLANPLGIDVEKPRLSWMLSAGQKTRIQTAYRILVASRPEILQKDSGDLWDSGRVNSSQSTWIEYAGTPLGSETHAYWKVQVWDEAGIASPWSTTATWSMGLLQPSDWHSKWIGERHPAGTNEGTPLPFPWLRKTFTLNSRPRRAFAYVNPLGYYELYINGRKVDDQVLSPAVSDYSKRNLYVAHDVTDCLVGGKNVVALWLGRGWYVKGHPGVIHDGPLVRAQVEIAMPDGSTVQVVTDESWKLRESPLTPLGRGTAFGDYGGERYDARLELDGWSETNLDDSLWQSAAEFNPPHVLTAAQMVEPNRIVETIKTIKVEPYAQGGWVIDMGKAFTGWLELRLPAISAGSTVKLEYSDEIQRDAPAPATTYAGADSSPRARSFAPQAQAGLEGNRAQAAGPTGARAGGAGHGGASTAFPSTFNQRDEVVGNGAPLTFRSRFNYHGFRYVRVIGLKSAPAAADATGYLIRAAYDRSGEFTSSNQLLNAIYRMVTRTYESLTLGGYVVDCPTRERLGYGGDAGTSLETGMFNFSSGGLYSRWLGNWRDSQDQATGSLPHTAPNYPNQGGGSPMWGGIVITLPWQMYLQYGDRRVLDVNYPMMQNWLHYLQSEASDSLLLTHKSHAMSMQRWNFLGDWLTPRGNHSGSDADPRPAQLINSLHYVYQLQLAAKIAAVLGKNGDAATYAALEKLAARSIHQKFYNAGDCSYGTGESIYEAFPLLTGVVPPELRKDVMDKLEHTIRVRNSGHYDTGMHGTYFLLKYLMEAGRNDLIYEMTARKDYPGWGYMLENGATTSWESWTGQSHIHDTLISIGAWFIEGIGGIRTDESAPGFKHFVIKPTVIGDLTFARAKYQSIHGEIVSEWRVENGKLKLNVTVPPGTTATVYVPGRGPVQTSIKAPEVKPSTTGNEGRSFEVLPGTSSFETAILTVR